MDVRRTAPRMLAFLAIGLGFGCEGSDATLPAADVLATFEPGAPQEEVVDALPDGGVEPSPRVEEGQLLHGYVFENFLVEAGNVEVLWVHDPAVGLPASREELRARLNPVVFVNGTFDGAGWRHYETRMDDWGLPEYWSIPTAQRSAPRDPSDVLPPEGPPGGVDSSPGPPSGIQAGAVRDSERTGN